MPYIYSVDGTLDVGEDNDRPIVEDYADRMPVKFDSGSTKWRSISRR